MLSFRIPRKLQRKKTRSTIQKKKQPRNSTKKSIRASTSTGGIVHASPQTKGAIVLKIDNFSVSKGKVESDKICVGGLQWQLRFERFDERLFCSLEGSHPSGNTAWSAWIDGSISYVNKKPELKDRTFSFKDVTVGQPRLEILLDHSTRTYWEALLNTEEGFVEHDSVEIRVDFTVKNVCGAAFDAFTVDGAYPSDAKLLVEDTVFHVNKGYLSVISPVFCAMFSDKYAEGHKKEIRLHDVKADDFKQFLMAVYPMRQPITDANVIAILRLMDFYDVKERFLECEKYLLEESGLPIVDKLLAADELRRNLLREALIDRMAHSDFVAVTEAANKHKLDPETVHAVLSWHVYLAPHIYPEKEFDGL